MENTRLVNIEKGTRVQDLPSEEGQIVTISYDGGKTLESFRRTVYKLCKFIENGGFGLMWITLIYMSYELQMFKGDPRAQVIKNCVWGLAALISINYFVRWFKDCIDQGNIGLPHATHEDHIV